MARDLIRVWRPADAAGLELRRGLGVRAGVARHWHDEYQICLVEHGGGTLRYRGTALATPPGSLFVMPPGEVHANDTPAAEGCTFRSMYVPEGMLAAAARETGGSRCPDFTALVFEDRALAARFGEAHRAWEDAGPPLAREAALLGALLALVGRHAVRPRPLPAAGRERTAVRRAREYLEAHFREGVSLADLARVAGLSPFHLSRVFRDELGLPPHAFQNQLRVHFARRLIEAGRPLALAAHTAGFADQSHLTRQFRRTMAVPPGAYRRKNVQDPPVPNA